MPDSAESPRTVTLTAGGLVLVAATAAWPDLPLLESGEIPVVELTLPCRDAVLGLTIRVALVTGAMRAAGLARAGGDGLA